MFAHIAMVVVGCLCNFLAVSALAAATEFVLTDKDATNGCYLFAWILNTAGIVLMASGIGGLR